MIKINVTGIICYILATLFLGYEMALQVSPAVMAEELMQDIGLNARSLSFISMAYFGAYAVMQIPSGMLFDKFNTKTVMTLSVAASTLGIYIFLISDSALVLALGRAITGFGSAFAFVGALVIAHEWFAKKHFPILVGIAQLIAALGAMFGEEPLAYVVNTYGWQQAVYNLSIAGALITLFIMFFVKNNRANKLKKSTSSFRDIFARLRVLLQNKQVWYLAVFAFFCWGPVTVFTELWGVSFLKAHLNISKIAAAKLASSIWIGIAIGAPIIGFIAAKLNKNRSILIFCSIAGFIATLWFIFGPADNIVVAHALAMVFGIAAASNILVFNMVLLHNSENENTGAAIGFMNMAVVAGGALLQPIVGSIIESSWDGFIRNGAHWYSANDYQSGLAIIPLCFLICVITSTYAIKE